MALNCPKCRSHLTEFEIEPGLYIDRCEDCKGTWLGKGELVMFATSKADVTKFQKELVSGNGGTLSCPECTKTMLELKYGTEELVVDYCKACFGLWLDKSELATIRTLMKQLRVKEKLGRIKSLKA
jgi:Zn-finger nucleic acid-binding protein